LPRAGQALHYIGLAKAQQGDPHGLADLEESVRLAESVGPALANRTANNFADALYEAADLERAHPLQEECLRRAEQIGNVEQIRFQQGIQAVSYWEQGRWQEALACADSLLADVEAGASHYHETAARVARSFISFARGDEERALGDAVRALEQGRAIADPQVLLASLAGAVRIYAGAGRFDDANAMLTEWLPLYSRSGAWLTSYTAILAAAVHRLGRGAELGAAVAASPSTPWAEAARAYARNDPAVAASIYGSFGAAVHAAEAHLLAAEGLIIAGRRTEANTHLHKALDFYRAVQATRFVREGEALLAAAS
jgi:tetratricopeptide (TPR) repeat protein